MGLFSWFKGICVNYAKLVLDLLLQFFNQPMLILFNFVGKNKTILSIVYTHCALSSRTGGRAQSVKNVILLNKDLAYS